MRFSIEAKLQDMEVPLNELSDALIGSFRDGVAVIAHAAHGEWQRIARARLSSARADYIRGLNSVGSRKTYFLGTMKVYEINLVGEMPNNFEFGMDSYDMKTAKPGWIGGGKKYTRIPFRHSESSRSNIGYTGKAKKSDLRVGLELVKKQYGLHRMIKAASGQAIPGPVRRVPRGAVHRGATKKLSSTPIHPYLRGLTRVQQTPAPGKKQGGSQTITWRTISEKSPAGSWIHPGIRAANILPEVEKFVDRELASMIDKLLQGS